jgi:hypothetical protein
MDRFLITGTYDHTDFSVSAKDLDELNRLIDSLSSHPGVVKFDVWKLFSSVE